jgi:glycosyltransferase involved in cell wall biosynthesis
MNKPILCFHVGYIPDINNIETKDTYGSEIALLNISEIFSEKFRVVIFGDAIHNEIVKNEIEFINSNKFDKFQNDNIIEVIILVRYIYPFLDYELKAKKIFLWIHDLDPMVFYQGISIYNNGKELLKNVIDKIDGIITLTNWHKNHFINLYDYDENKVFVIGNGIDVKKFKGGVKQKNKFIWASHGLRGLNVLIEYLIEIKKHLPDAELYVYRDESNMPNDIIENMKKYDYIHYLGKIDNDSLIKEFESSEMWLYPTQFPESYCISALEAQMSKCVCVVTNFAALTETVGDRGVLINDPIYSENYKINAINNVIEILTNDELKKQYQDKAYKWAIEQTWEKRAEQWYELFNKK